METVSKTTIVSNALVSLGEEPISNFEENTKIDPVAKIYYTRRDSLLRSHPWNCAIKRAKLAAKVIAEADVTQVDYTYTYALPSDYLRMLQVGKINEEPDYIIEGREILSNEPDLRIKYVYKNHNEATWDAMLIEAMELAMIAAIAYTVTESTSKEKAAIAKFNDFMGVARAVDGQENPPEQMGDTYLVNSRFGNQNYHA